RGPDVVEELDLDNGLEAACSHSGCTSDNVGFGERGIEDAVGAELHLEPSGQLEHAAFSLDQLLLDVLFTAVVGDIFAEDKNALVAAHLVAQRSVDKVRHRLWLRSCRLLSFRIWVGSGERRWRVKCCGSRIEIG